jgi:A/G-specific adenine glycosylase
MVSSPRRHYNSHGMSRIRSASSHQKPPLAGVPEPLATNRLRRALLDWYDASARKLPWRAGPRERPDPYAVWLSEIMLQQTTVAAVVPYYESFLRRWPTMRDLAQAPLDDVLAAWAGLGYYARARNLHACARAVVDRHGGRLPADAASLCALPGIGDYTAGAIAAIAFGENEPAVDGNVTRVLARLTATAEAGIAARKAVRPLAAALAAGERPGDVAQALMDLGATVCTPRAPACPACPWRSGCRAFAEGRAEAFPSRVKKSPRPVRHGVAFWLCRSDGLVMMRRRPPRGLLGGMLEFPGTQWTGEPPGADDIAEAVPAGAVQWRSAAGHVRHVFTHFELVLAVHTAHLPDHHPVPDGVWLTSEAMAGAALPSVMRKVARHAIAFEASP